jgi:hypothetical protein
MTSPCTDGKKNMFIEKLIYKIMMPLTTHKQITSLPPLASRGGGGGAHDLRGGLMMAIVVKLIPTPLLPSLIPQPSNCQLLTGVGFFRDFSRHSTQTCLSPVHQWCKMKVCCKIKCDDARCSDMDGRKAGRHAAVHCCIVLQLFFATADQRPLLSTKHLIQYTAIRNGQNVVCRFPDTATKYLPIKPLPPLAAHCTMAAGAFSRL